MNTKKSDTPRTDNEEFISHEIPGLSVVNADFACGLEREINKLREERDELVKGVNVMINSMRMNAHECEHWINSLPANKIFMDQPSLIVESELKENQIEEVHQFGECWVKNYDRKLREHFKCALRLWATDKKIKWKD